MHKILLANYLMLWLNARNISGLGNGTRLFHAQTSQIADSETNI